MKKMRMDLSTWCMPHKKPLVLQMISLITKVDILVNEIFIQM